MSKTEEERSNNNIWGAIERIHEAYRVGRTIVPLVGAGISAESGIPVVRSIVRYFGKFQQLIEHQAFYDTANVWDGISKELKDKTHSYQQRPWHFVSDFGWPDRFQLNQDLLSFIREQRRTSPAKKSWIPDSIVEAAQCGLEHTLKHVNPTGFWNARLLAHGVGAELISLLYCDKDGKELPITEALKIASAYFTNRFDNRDTKAGNNASEKLREDLAPLTPTRYIGQPITASSRTESADQLLSVFRRFETDGSSSIPFDLSGDWKRLIQYFTNYQGDYADSLISRFCAGRLPSLGHHMVGYLSRLLGSKLIMTYNFDDLIERSLLSQGVVPRVFGLEEGIRLPPETLVRDSVSVFKLHGNNHALLLDERVDHPLSKEYKERFDALVKPNPLLLIVGCSGGDMRVRDLFRHVVSEGKGEAVWLHFEKDAPDCVREAPKGANVTAVRTNNPGADLMHIYGQMTGRHPAAGNLCYPVVVTRPSPIPGTKTGGVDLNGDGLTGHIPKERWSKLIEPGQSAVILSTMHVSIQENCVQEWNASQELLRAADHWLAEGYQIIWVDLESVHTMSGVVGSILDQCRAYDIHLAPSVLPDDGTPGGIRLAVRRVAHALERSRYFVVLDGLETYSWGPLTHHGTTHQAGKSPQQITDDFVYFLEFFFELAREGKLFESRIWLGADPPKARYQAKLGPDQKSMNELIHRRDQILAMKFIGSKFANVVELDDVDFQKAVFADETQVGGIAHFPLSTLLPNSAKQVKAIPGRFGETPEKSQAFWAFVLHHLACFRRSRSLPTVRNMLGVLYGKNKTTEAVDMLLAELANIKGLGITRLSGGAVWFSRSIRDFIYRNNSKHATHDAIRYLKNPEQTLIQLFLLTTTHQRISRSYYSRAFVQSRDCFAFLEHTYHRVSSIRYLAKLIAVISRINSDPNLKPLVARSFKSCGQFYKDALFGSTVKDPESFNDILGRIELSIPNIGLDWGMLLNPDSGSVPDIDDLILALCERHTWEMRSLYRGWVRAERDLREQIPAQQLLHWCDRLRTEELDHHLNMVVVGYSDNDIDPKCWSMKTNEPVQIKLSNDHCRSKHDTNLLINSEAQPWIEAFAVFLLDLQIRLHMDRTDYTTALKLIKIRARAGALHQMHSILDEATCHLRASYQLKNDDLQHIIDREECDRLLILAQAELERLHQVVKTLEASGSQPADKAIEELRRGITDDNSVWRLHELASAVTDWHEARLRLEHLRAEYHLEDISVFTPGFTLEDDLTNPDDSESKVSLVSRNIKPERHEAAKTSIDLGRFAYRSQVPYGGRGPHSTVVERSIDGTTYPAYRSIFFTLSGRNDWQKTLASYSNLLAIQTAVSKSSPDAVFEAAYRDFELARAGLGNDNKLLLAMNELYFVEACLVHARIDLYRNVEKIPATDRAAGGKAAAGIGAADALHDDARYALQRAREHLSLGRRNAVWWQFYYRITAQYHAERMCLELLRSAGEDLVESVKPLYSGNSFDPGKRLPLQLTRLRRGYNAIRNGLDYTLPDQNGKIVSRWLTRSWAEMTLAALLLGLDHLFYQKYKQKSKDEREHKNIVVADRLRASESIRAQLLWINKREALTLDKGEPLGQETGIGLFFSGDVENALSQHYFDSAFKQLPAITDPTTRVLKIRGWAFLIARDLGAKN